MPDLTRVVAALAALARATPAVYVTINKHDDHTSIGLSHDSDANARATAGALGIELSLGGNAENEWLRGSLDLCAVTVTVCGAHHARQKAVDSSAITAALAQAEEAVSE